MSNQFALSDDRQGWLSIMTVSVHLGISASSGAA
jgi:hypothetical protein